jgi:peptidoglycan/xylan/chitin deacetylase (PgdA/CDA1 family)
MRCLRLTIDDGPYEFRTHQILDILSDHDVKATFFLIGKQVDKWSGVLECIHDEGHLIGNHSYTHSSLRGLTEWQIRHEVQRTAQSLKYLNTFGLFRPPYGEHDQRTDDILESMGYSIVMWDVLIERFINADSCPTDPVIVLGHQDLWMIDNLDDFIRGAKKKGCRFILDNQPQHLFL